MDVDGPRHLALVGPTASGKSALALAAAVALGDVEIVTVDSMQVYRGMDIGTAKATASERTAVPHHLLDVADPGERYTVARFQRDVEAVLADIDARGRRALLVGGTGLYLQAVVDDLTIPGEFPDVRAGLEAEPDTAALHERLASLDPVAAARMEPSNRRRVVRALEVTIGSGRPFSSYGPGVHRGGGSRFRIAGLWLPRHVLGRRIEERVQAMLEDGFLDEVRSLLGRAGGWERTARQALGYRELAEHLEGRTTLEEAVDAVVRRTRAFARRQRVWFRRDPRITWFGAPEDPGTVLPALLGDWVR